MNHSFVNVFIILLTYERVSCGQFLRFQHTCVERHFLGLAMHFSCVVAFLMSSFFKEIIISRCSRDHIPEICMIKWNETVIMIMIRKKKRERWKNEKWWWWWWCANIIGKVTSWEKKFPLVFFNLYLWEISIAVYVHFYMF